ncbi:MAG TPA: hypothetical protein PLT82_13220 [Candidatus Hydrogenedens sp.]|nr:hypothetical protein [Candidatus Hydrogenedens sp.]HOL21181.1 hypothetical protein [Candidatus Hydrogenedens sp.]HPP60083.1 hypothetical protein [Candidatus Hydrogenedens sp.]
MVAMLSVLGCAGMGKGPSDEELIRSTIDKVKTALESKNLDLLMTTFADDFEHPEVGGKEEARQMLQLGLESGYADEGKVDLSNMEIKIAEDGTATAYPIDLSSAAGSVSVELVLKKYETTNDKGKKVPAWLVKTINVDGL